jgi:hypothetical protein
MDQFVGDSNPDSSGAEHHREDPSGAYPSWLDGGIPDEPKVKDQQDLYWQVCIENQTVKRFRAGF